MTNLKMKKILSLLPCTENINEVLPQALINIVGIR